MKRKSVCIIAEVENGYGVKSHEFAREIARQGNAVELVSCRFNVFGAPEYQQPVEGIRLIHTPMSVYDNRHGVREWTAFFKQIGSRVAILQRSSMFFGTHAFLMACRRHFRKVHFIQRFPDGPMPRAKKVRYLGGLIEAPPLWWCRERMNRPLKSLYADRIIAISQFMREYLIKDWGYPSWKIHCVMNGVDWRRFARDNGQGQAFREARNLPREAVVFGVLARLHKEKGVDLALQALRMLKDKYPARDMYLVIAGDGPEYQNLVEATLALGLEPWVRFCGHLPDPRPALYAIDILLAPTRSRMEAFGLSVAEAMAAGCIPIVSAEGGMAEIVNNASCGWRIRPDDAQALFEAMEEALNTGNADRKAIQTNALNRVKEHFDAETNYRRIMQVLKI